MTSRQERTCARCDLFGLAAPLRSPLSPQRGAVDFLSPEVDLVDPSRVGKFFIKGIRVEEDEFGALARHSKRLDQSFGTKRAVKSPPRFSKAGKESKTATGGNFRRCEIKYLAFTGRCMIPAALEPPFP
jgi:hypothetical protein